MRLRVSADPAGGGCGCWTLGMPTPPLAWVLLFARDRLPTTGTTTVPGEVSAGGASPRLDVRDRDGIAGEMAPDPKPPTMALVGLALPPPRTPPPLPRIDWKSIPPRRCSWSSSPPSWDAFGARLVSDEGAILLVYGKK